MKISNILQKWYKLNKRILPWRETSNPYYIWISEVILQQTRVQQGMEYYLNFIREYPDINTLASADKNNVLKLWEGLGYYNRALNLLEAANYIKNNHNGQLPDNYDDLIKIKGIGKYTAAAISSIAFNKSVPVVDGNVIRLLSRFYGIYENMKSSAGINSIYKLAGNIIDPKNPGNHNQSLMEFGALVCTPKNPGCKDCVLNKKCFAFQNQATLALPVNKKNITIRNRYFNYLVILSDSQIVIKQRKEKDIWKDLYDFPLIETNRKFSLEELIENKLWKSIKNIVNTNEVTIRDFKPHILSHQLIHATFFILQLKGSIDLQDNNFMKINISSIKNYPVPRLIDKFINSMDFTNPIKKTTSL